MRYLTLFALLLLVLPAWAQDLGQLRQLAQARFPSGTQDPLYSHCMYALLEAGPRHLAVTSYGARGSYHYAVWERRHGYWSYLFDYSSLNEDFHPDDLVKKNEAEARTLFARAGLSQAVRRDLQDAPLRYFPK